MPPCSWEHEQQHAQPSRGEGSHPGQPRERGSPLGVPVAMTHSSSCRLPALPPTWPATSSPARRFSLPAWQSPRSACPRAFAAPGVTRVRFANNDNSPSMSRGSAFCAVVTSSNGVSSMLLGGRPVDVHRTEYTRRVDTVFKICRAKRQDAGNTNSMGCGRSAGTFIDGTRSSYHQWNMHVAMGSSQSCMADAE